MTYNTFTNSPGGDRRNILCGLLSSVSSQSLSLPLPFLLFQNTCTRIATHPLHPIVADILCFFGQSSLSCACKSDSNKVYNQERGLSNLQKDGYLLCFSFSSNFLRASSSLTFTFSSRSLFLLPFPRFGPSTRTPSIIFFLFSAAASTLAFSFFLSRFRRVCILLLSKVP